jgi:bifunctional enzyme CysN/CysC
LTELLSQPLTSAPGDSSQPEEQGFGGGLPMLRFLTCGSVGDGKSTLVDRLVLLDDGVQAEREQGITIDAAYRYFATDRRAFVVADAPGHEQYTRNMVAAASDCALALLLVDARKGLLTQTRRHSCIASLLGIRHIVLAVNKMDAVEFDRATFEKIEQEYRSFASGLEVDTLQCIPISALRGDNVSRRSASMPWYRGPTLVSYLETADAARADGDRPLRFPVQWVCRANQDFRGYAGTIVGGKLAAGDTIVALPSGRSAKVASIVTPDGALPEAGTGEAVMVTLAEELDIGRGDVLCHPTSRAEIADQFAANLFWMGEQPLLPGRVYIMRCGTQWATAQVTDLKYKLDVDTLAHVAGRQLDLNEIGLCNFTVSKPLAIDPYAENRDTGGFIIVDRATNATVGAGMIRFGLRRAHNIHWQSVDVSKRQRSDIKGQTACCLWFTGLSGSGKSTIANLLERRLHDLGRHTYILDGDNVRHGLNRDLGFTDADRVENIRRTAEVARLLVDAGLITIASFISPFRAERQFARERFESGEFFEVFVDAALEVCEARDPKGLYRRARLGQISNFTGITSPYEPPAAPELHLRTDRQPPELLVDLLVSQLEKKGII